MALSLVHYEVITTTSAKAKALRTYFEKLMVRAKKNDENARRYVRSLTNDKLAIKKIFEVLVPRYADRATGFVSVKKIGIRPSDSSEMSEVALIGGKKVLHIVRAKKAKKTKPQTQKKTQEKAKPVEKPLKKEVVKPEKTTLKKEAPEKPQKPMPKKSAEKPEAPKEEKKEVKKETLAQRLGKFLGFRSRSSVKPEDD